MSIYDFEAKTIDGTTQKLDAYKGKALLIVNVASKCGFTPQYTGLEALQKKLQDKGFNVLGSHATNSATKSRATKTRSRIFAR